MNHVINETHDPHLESWIESAAQSQFPIQNLPFGAFRRHGSDTPPRIGVAIGDFILDLAACSRSGLLDGLDGPLIEACAQDSLNALMALGRDHWFALRKRLSRLLSAGAKGASRERRRTESALVPMDETEMVMPVCIGDYTDFYASIHHARNVGSLFRPDHPLLANYRYLPIGYHGRASSIVISGTSVRRPCGQTARANSAPEFGPSRMLDYELEVGAFVGYGNPLGEPIPISEAEYHLFGICLLNDWSARDIQRWEYQPLGPFLGKSFATTISPWVISMEALAPYRVPAFLRPPDDPAPLPYLSDPVDREGGGIDLTLKVFLRSTEMRARNLSPMLLSQCGFKDMYWTLAQLLTHHASNGCNLRTGDLLGSGTVSGSADGSGGSLLELTRQGIEPLALPSGESRRFLEDGDEITLGARAERAGFATIGFGECRGVIVEAGPLS